MKHTVRLTQYGGGSVIGRDYQSPNATATQDQGSLRRLSLCGEFVQETLHLKSLKDTPEEIDVTVSTQPFEGSHAVYIFAPKHVGGLSQYSFKPNTPPTDDEAMYLNGYATLEKFFGPGFHGRIYFSISPA